MKFCWACSSCVRGPLEHAFDLAKLHAVWLNQINDLIFKELIHRRVKLYLELITYLIIIIQLLSSIKNYFSMFILDHTKYDLKCFKPRDDAFSHVCMYKPVECLFGLNYLFSCFCTYVFVHFPVCSLLIIIENHCFYFTVWDQIVNFFSTWYNFGYKMYLFVQI